MKWNQFRGYGPLGLPFETPVIDTALLTRALVLAKKPPASPLRDSLADFIAAIGHILRGYFRRRAFR